MSGLTLVGMIGVHIALWLTQVMLNTIVGGDDCTVSTLACGSGALEQLSDIIRNTKEIDGLGGLFNFVTSTVIDFINAFFQIAFFSYEWLNEGGQIVDTFTVMLRIILGCIFIANLGRTLIGIVAGRLPF